MSNVVECWLATATVQWRNHAAVSGGGGLQQARHTGNERRAAGWWFSHGLYSEGDEVLIVRDIMASTYRLSSVATTRKFYEQGSLAATAGVSAYGEMSTDPRVADIG